jgi:uncharacterized protein (TIGR02147 family)
MLAFARRVYEYLDYRQFLADYYAHQKLHGYGFSYRVLAQRAGCRSMNHPHLVIKGCRNLTPAMALRFAEACELKQDQAAYFADLVAFNQAKSQNAREQLYARLSRYAPFRKVQHITLAQASYFSKWYIPATRELAARPDFVATPKWIASQLLPAITVTQAQEALGILTELGLLSIDAAGLAQRSEPLVSSGGPLGHHLVAFHQAMIARASEAIELIERDEREISCVTVCVSQKRLLELKQRVREFRQQLLQSAELGDTPECVVQINFQLFPLSKRSQSKL